MYHLTPVCFVCLFVYLVIWLVVWLFGWLATYVWRSIDIDAIMVGYFDGFGSSRPGADPENFSRGGPTLSKKKPITHT